MSCRLIVEILGNGFGAPLALGLLVLLSSCSLFDSRKDEPPLPGRIVFSSGTSGEHQIYTVRPDGSGLRQVTHFEQNGAYEPAWSPDGELIIFVTSMQATTLGMSLFVMDADGANLRPLKRFEEASPAVLFGARPAWSPDGQRIAYDVCTNCELGGLNYDIWIEEVEGEMYDPERSVRLTDDPASDMSPAWSPDGRRIAFMSNRDYVRADSARYRHDLYLIGADRSNLRRLTKNISVGPPAWSSDGKYVAFGSEGKIMRVDVENVEVSELSASLPDGYRFHPLSWSVEHNIMLLLSFTLKPRQRHLHILNTQSGEVQEVLSDPDLTSADWSVRE